MKTHTECTTARARARYIVYSFFFTQVHDVKSKTQWGKPNVKFHSLVPRGDHLNVEYMKTHTECTTARARRAHDTSCMRFLHRPTMLNRTPTRKTQSKISFSGPKRRPSQLGIYENAHRIHDGAHEENAHRAPGQLCVRKHAMGEGQGSRARGGTGPFCVGKHAMGEGQGRRARGGPGPFRVG